MTSEQETATAIIAKAAPPVSVSLATVLGVQVSELVLWATLIYTLLLITKLAYNYYKDIKKD
jgi:hypothetical protein